MSKIKFRDDGTILIQDVRLSYPHLFTPYQHKGEGKPKFSARFILSNDTHSEEIKALKNHLHKMMLEAFKGKIPLSNLFFRNGDDTGKDEFENTWYVQASEKPDRRPTVIDCNRKPLVEADGKPYAGCYVDALIRPWIQNSAEWGKRINANLLAVQFRRDGEAFADNARPDVNDVFDDLGGGSSGGDFEDGSDPFADD